MTGWGGANLTQLIPGQIISDWYNATQRIAVVEYAGLYNFTVSYPFDIATGSGGPFCPGTITGDVQLTTRSTVLWLGVQWLVLDERRQHNLSERLECLPSAPHVIVCSACGASGCQDGNLAVCCSAACLGGCDSSGNCYACAEGYVRWDPSYASNSMHRMPNGTCASSCPAGMLTVGVKAVPTGGLCASYSNPTPTTW